MWFFRLFLVGAVCQLLHKPRTYVERRFCELKRSLRMLTRDAAPEYVVINSILHCLGAFFESELGGFCIPDLVKSLIFCIFTQLLWSTYSRKQAHTPIGIIISRLESISRGSGRFSGGSKCELSTISSEILDSR